MSANVESPRTLIRSIGSICTATLRGIECPEAHVDRVAVIRPHFRRLDKAQSAFRIECTLDMARNASGCHQDRVKPHVAELMLAQAREKNLGSRRDARTLSLGDRPSCIV